MSVPGDTEGASATAPVKIRLFGTQVRLLQSYGSQPVFPICFLTPSTGLHCRIAPQDQHRLLPPARQRRRERPPPPHPDEMKLRVTCDCLSGVRSGGQGRGQCHVRCPVDGAPAWFPREMVSSRIYSRCSLRVSALSDAALSQVSWRGHREERSQQEHVHVCQAGAATAAKYGAKSLGGWSCCAGLGHGISRV